MTPAEFERTLSRQAPAPVYLFVGPELYRRQRARRLLIDAVLPDPADREEGLTRHDLDELSLNDVIDDARAMSLFAGRRLIWASPAESVLPRGRAAAGDDASEAGPAKGAGLEALTSYCADPTPGVVVLFDARRWGFDGEDKTKLERLQKFFAPVRAVVEFRPFSPQEARELARSLAAERKLTLGPAEVDLLVEATGADGARIANEMEKLSLYAAERGKVTVEDISALVADAQETTVFNLVNALARRNRAESMALLDTLVRAGEYLPLALTFLSGIFRLALVARDERLRSAQDVQGFFQRRGTPMWRARAEQIYTASAKFSTEKLEEALSAVFRADRDLKSTRADDRLVLEEFVLRLTR
jgi:DNA polymerase-3 subunit delta